MPDEGFLIVSAAQSAQSKCKDSVSNVFCLLCDEEVGAYRRATIHFEGDGPDLVYVVHERCVRNYEMFTAAWRSR